MKDAKSSKRVFSTEVLPEVNYTLRKAGLMSLIGENCLIGSPLLDFLSRKGPGCYDLRQFTSRRGLRWLLERGLARRLGNSSIVLFKPLFGEVTWKKR